MIIYCGGANDVAIGYNTHKVWQNIEEALRIVRPLNCLFLLLTIPPMNWSEMFNSLHAINGKIMSTKHIQNCLPIDIFTALEKKRRLDRKFDAGDGVHLSIQGYKKVGETIFEEISKIIVD